MTNYGALINSFGIGQAAQAQAYAQAELLRQQAALVRQQQEALQQQEQLEAQQQADAKQARLEAQQQAAQRQVASERDGEGVTTLPPERSTEALHDPREEERAAQLLLLPREQIMARVSAAPYEELKYKAELYEAFRRDAPRDSAMYRYAGEALPLIYAELAQRVR
jgi:multidrug efflux pump subunit AcrA (membrane-fusion protein)